MEGAVDPDEALAGAVALADLADVDGGDGAAVGVVLVGSAVAGVLTRARWMIRRR